MALLENAPVAMSWSGGKDSCLAYYRAINKGYKVDCLLNFISVASKRCCFHGLSRELVELQAKALGVPVVFKEMPDGMADYEKAFKAAVRAIKGIEGMVFGDIYLDEHKAWLERVCNDAGVVCIEPLWNGPPAGLMNEFIDLGFKAIVVSCQEEKFGKDFAGRYVDRTMLRELEEKNICLCGENGEFHTFVVDGPVFTKEIRIVKSETILINGFWKHWFLDIKEYRCLDKRPEKKKK